jgi:tellurite resistance protein
MPHRGARNRLGATQAEIIAAYVDDREDELLDAVITAAALVAQADGRAKPVERGELLDFLDRNEFLSVFTRAEIFDAFERRIGELQEPGSLEPAVDSLGRLAGRSLARLVVDASEAVAAADGHLHPRERRILQLIRIALGAQLPPSAPSPRDAGGAG